MQKIHFNTKVIISFIIGFVVGGAVVALLAFLFIYQAVQGVFPQSSPFGPLLNNFRQGVIQVNNEQNSSSVHGQVTANAGNSLTVQGNLGGKEASYTFVYDDKTQFITLANDDASTKIPLKPSDIMVGDSVTVFANEVVGSVQNQQAVEVLKM